MKFNVPIIVPFVNQHTASDGTREGFYLTLSNDVFPIVTMNPDLGLETAQKFWKVMGYQVSDIVSKMPDEWVRDCPSTQDVMKSFTGFKTEINNLPADVLNYFERNYEDRVWYDEDGEGFTHDDATVLADVNIDIDSEEEIEYVYLELNKEFCKFSVSYKMLSNILFFDPKRVNYINKNTFEFVALRSEIEKISSFYNDNQTKFSIEPILEGDIAYYKTYNESLEASVELTVEG